MTEQEELPRFLTVAEAAKALRVSKNSIYRWIRSGRLRAYKFKRKMLVDPADIVDGLVEVIPSEVIPASEVERVRNAGIRRVRLKLKEGD